MVRQRVVCWVLAGILTLLAGMGTAQDGAAYQLGRQDVVAIRAVTWDSELLRFTELEAVSGEYVLGEDGRLMVPITGEVEAAGLTPTELADQISFLLERVTGADEPPSVTVRVAQFRPVYVLGEVQRPGEYPYRPGLRVGQAVALSGGFFRVRDADASGLGREAIRAGGSLREHQLDLLRRRLQEARLLAESRSEDQFAPPADLSHPDGAAALKALIARESALFAARQDALAREEASLRQSLGLLRTEITALEGKKNGLDEQITMMRDAVGNMETLLERGLARSPNLMALQRALIDLESRQLDADTQVFRARQQIAETEREIADLRDRRATNVLDELAMVQSEIARLKVRITTTQQILLETGAEAQLAEAQEDAPALIPRFVLTRESGGGVIRIEADQDTVMAPLDLLEVAWHENDPG